MIDYELAKKLKDAGFEHVPVFMSTNAGLSATSEYIYYPTLEELIEACGKTYKEGEVTYEFVLLWIDDTWYAGYSDKDHTRPKIKDGKGTTPEEAVTRLYLSLHK